MGMASLVMGILGIVVFCWLGPVLGGVWAGGLTAASALRGQPELITWPLWVLGLSIGVGLPGVATVLGIVTLLRSEKIGVPVSGLVTGILGAILGLSVTVYSVMNFVGVDEHLGDATSEVKMKDSTKPVETGMTYEPSWESLAKHEGEPEWLKDAKLGIYFHWGVYSVPAFGDEWYPRWIHFEHRGHYKHHVETYGLPTTFGYHDFVPMFKAEKFDPEAWAELFKRAGARFAGPVAEHHDGFAMWDSDVTPWNAADKGPKRDITGELFASLKKRGLKTIATFHHARNLQRYGKGSTYPNEGKGGRAFWDSHYPYIEGQPPTSEDPTLRLLYGNVPEPEWLETVWLGKLKEVVDKYQPDIIWFDAWLDRIPEDFRKQFSAYYLNAAKKWNKDVVIARKQDDLPLDFSINDHEKSREAKALENLWMTDDTISTGSWCYTADLKIKPLDMVVHALIDTVSKNGVMLLNISPKADGEIPADQMDVLTGLGDWLKVNGEAIYDTRPWVNAAEGPTTEPSGGFKDHKKFLKLKYSAADIRYTAAKDKKTVYATLLGVPYEGTKVTLSSFAGTEFQAGSVTLLTGGEVPFEQTDAGLILTVPANVKNCKDATAFKIALK